MSENTLHGMLERLPHKQSILGSINYQDICSEDCPRCALQPIADQLQAVVDEMEAHAKTKRPGSMLGRWAGQLQRILGTKV